MTPVGGLRGDRVSQGHACRELFRKLGWCGALTVLRFRVSVFGLPAVYLDSRLPGIYGTTCAVGKQVGS